MPFKGNEDIVAAVDLQSGADEWPWRVPAGTPGRIVSQSKGVVEVHFNCGVVRLCKESELRRKGAK